MSTECSDDELLVPELMSSYDRHRSDFVNRTHSRVGHLKTWPTSIGIMQIVIGFLLVFLGLLEVFIIPITEDHTAKIQLTKATCYGAGLFAGLVMVLTGSTAVRATISRRTTTIIRFYNLTIITIVLYTALTVFLISAYSLGWTSSEAFPPDSQMRTVHMFVTIMMVMGLMFSITAFVQYYDIICCGQVRLWDWWVGVFCSSCLRPQTVAISNNNSTTSLLGQPSSDFSHFLM